MYVDGTVNNIQPNEQRPVSKLEVANYATSTTYYPMTATGQVTFHGAPAQLPKQTSLQITDHMGGLFWFNNDNAQITSIVLHRTTGNLVITTSGDQTTLFGATAGARYNVGVSLTLSTSTLSVSERAAITNFLIAGSGYRWDPDVTVTKTVVRFPGSLATTTGFDTIFTSGTQPDAYLLRTDRQVSMTLGMDLESYDAPAPAMARG
jgi:hypothetical protein